jgi:hypothetical protein
MGRADEQVTRNGPQPPSKVDAMAGAREGRDPRINNDGRIEVARGEARREQETFRTTVVKSDRDDRNSGASNRYSNEVHSDQGEMKMHSGRGEMKMHSDRGERKIPTTKEIRD